MHNKKIVKIKKQISVFKELISKCSFRGILRVHFKLFTSSILSNVTKQACSPFITLVNSITSAGYDSCVDGSSSNGLHVLAIGRRCYPLRVAK